MYQAQLPAPVPALAPALAAAEGVGGVVAAEEEGAAVAEEARPLPPVEAGKVVL
ncbi:hypothetical protein LQZ19_04915 [Treponema primitia]|uniref:hypothetical protein n=1 Tax=Treponema primitia TaxID=88058 RepID=UPI00398003C2